MPQEIKKNRKLSANDFVLLFLLSVFLMPSLFGRAVPAHADISGSSGCNGTQPTVDLGWGSPFPDESNKFPPPSSPSYWNILRLSPQTNLGQFTGNSYTDTSVSNNTGYDYFIWADEFKSTEQTVSVLTLNCAQIFVSETPVTGGSWVIMPGGCTSSPCTVNPSSAGTTNYTLTVNSIPLGQDSSSVSNSDGTGSSMVLSHGNTKSFTITYTPPPLPVADIKANNSDAPITIPTGSSANLTWSSLNATSCSGTNFSTGGALNNSTGVSTGALFSSQTYTITCDNGSNSDSDPVTVNVAGSPPVVTISANPTSGTVDVVNPSLTWSATNSPTSCTASGDWSGSKAVSGTNVSQGVLTVVKTYTYTLSCSNASGTGSASASVVVTSATPAPSVSLSVSPASITSGGNSTLTWTTSNATSCNAGASPANSQWNGAKALNNGSPGQTITGITTTTLFSLTCNGAGGTGADSKTVTVTATPVPVVTISANPTSGTVDVVNPSLTWSATNSPTSCTASGDWSGSKAVSGTNVSQGVLTVVKTYTYTLTCSNSGGTSAPASATVNVNSPSTATINVSEVNASGGSWTISPGSYTGTSNVVSPNSSGTSYSISATPPGGYSVSSYTNTDGSGSSMTVFPGNTKTFNINYSAVSSFDYSLSGSNPPSVFPGGATQTSVSKTLTSGTSQAVFTSVTGLPAGITPSYDANRDCSPSCSTTVTFNVATSVAPGNYSVTVQGTAASGPTRNLPLTISVSTPPSVSVSCSANPSPVAVGQPTTWTATVLGGIGPFTYQWSFDGGTFSAPVSVNTSVKTYQTTGLKTADALVTDSLGTTSQCSTSSGIGTVQVNINPTYKEF